MNIDDSGQCRASLAELEQDRALGVNDTTEQIVADRVAELMSEGSTDEDSIVVLMESDAFVRALRNVLSTPTGRDYSTKSMRRLHMANQLVKEAEIQLSRYVEVNL